MSSGYMYVKYDKSSANEFQLTSLTGESFVSTGDPLSLNCLADNKVVGRYYSLSLYYSVATGGE